MELEPDTRKKCRILIPDENSDYKVSKCILLVIVSEFRCPFKINLNNIYGTPSKHWKLMIYSTSILCGRLLFILTISLSATHQHFFRAKIFYELYSLSHSVTYWFQFFFLLSYNNNSALTRKACTIQNIFLAVFLLFLTYLYSFF